MADRDTDIGWIVQKTVESAIREGHIDPKGKSEGELKSDIRKYLNSFRNPRSEIAFIIEHDYTILKAARAFLREGEELLACILYATWIEHQMNKIIRSRAIQVGFSEQSVKEILRDTSLRAKMSWLLQALGLPQIAKHHYDAIMRLTDRRNSYVHYKYVPRLEEEIFAEEAQLHATVVAIEKSVVYLKRYEAKRILHSSSRQTRGALR